MALPVLIAVLWLALSALAAAGASLRCADAARLAARAAGRGDPPAAVLALARAAAPPGATVTVRPEGALVAVTVRVRLRVAGPFGRLLPPVSVAGTARAEREL